MQPKTIIPKTTIERHFISNLIYYFEQEKQNNGPLIPLTAIRERVANALQIGVARVNRASAAARRNEPIALPKAKRKRASLVADVNSFEISAIRNVIHDMYTKKIPIHIRHLNNIVSEDNIFKGSASSLRRILSDIGFSWKEIENKRTMYEHPEIIRTRVNFLCNFIKNLKSENPLPCIYLDESCIYEKNVKKNVRKEIILHGKKYIIFHADSSLVPVMRTQKPDSHAKVNPIKLVQLMEDFAKLLKTPSIIIVEDVPFFNVQIKTNPTIDWTKPKIQEWLENHDIPFDQDMLKWQLLDIASKNEEYEKYLIDDIAETKGHLVLKLPKFHCTFNPIENACSIAKAFYHHPTKIEALQTISSDMWENCMDHTIKEINRWYERELLLDQENGETYMCIGDNDNDSSESESE